MSANQETTEQRDTALLAASSIPLDATAIGLTARVTSPEPPESRQWKVAITVDARDVSLETANAYQVGALDLLFVQRAPDGKQLNAIKSELPIRWDHQSYESHVAEGISLIKLLDVVPTATQLRIVVRDRRSGKLGSLGIPLDRIRRPRAAPGNCAETIAFPRTTCTGRVRRHCPGRFGEKGKRREDPQQSGIEAGAVAQR